MKAFVVIFGVLLGLIATCLTAQEAYPSRPLQIVTTNSSGTTADIISRLFADKLQQRLGQSVLVQNRPGAGGTLATQSVAVARPDGYTLLMANLGHSVNPHLYHNLPYDSIRDFVGVALVAEAPVVILVPPSLKARSLKEFVALAKQQPSTINYASAGAGTPTHLAGAYFASLVQIDLVHVPYKSLSNIMADILGGRVQAAFFPLSPVLAYVQEGKLLALGVSSTKPMREPLNVPTARESIGIDYIFNNWFGFVAPAKTPTPILETLSRTIRGIAEGDDFHERYKALGLIPRVVVMSEFDAYIKEDMSRLGPVVKASGAVAN